MNYGMTYYRKEKLGGKKRRLHKTPYTIEVSTIIAHLVAKITNQF